MKCHFILWRSISKCMLRAVLLSRILEFIVNSCKMVIQLFFLLRESRRILLKARSVAPLVLTIVFRDSKEHAQRRRHMGVLFNRSRIPVLIPMMIEEIYKFVRLLDSISQQDLVDLVPICRALEADIVCP